jgi:hypothetical protein
VGYLLNFNWSDPSRAQKVLTNAICYGVDGSAIGAGDEKKNDIFSATKTIYK